MQVQNSTDRTSNLIDSNGPTASNVVSFARYSLVISEQERVYDVVNINVVFLLKSRSKYFKVAAIQLQFLYYVVHDALGIAWPIDIKKTERSRGHSKNAVKRRAIKLSLIHISEPTRLRRISY